MALFFWVGAIYIALGLIREEIVADESGLRWRSVFFGWKSARWDEISDFYLIGKTTRWSPVQTSPEFVRPTVETPHGKLKMERSFTNLSELMPFIAARALNSSARDWEIFEFRASQNFSQRFDYWTNTQKWHVPSFLGTFALIAVLIVVGNLSSPQTKISNGLNPFVRPPDMAWPMFYFPFLIGIPLFGSVGIMCILSFWMMWRERKFASARRDEHLEISPRGLAWQRGEARIDAAWDEIRAARYVAGDRQNAHFLIETANGDFVVWRSLDTLSLWVRLVNQFAPQLELEIPSADPDLGAESATWSGKKVGVGARVFHFRTRDTRLFLWGATVIAPLFPLAPFLSQAMKTPDDAPSAVPAKALLLALFLIVLALIYAWLCFARAAIWADETGLEWRVPLLKTRRVGWSEIESHGRDDGAEWIVAGGKKRRLWRILAPVRQSGLREIIASRAGFSLD